MNEISSSASQDDFPTFTLPVDKISPEDAQAMEAFYNAYQKNYKSAMNETYKEITGGSN